jgi:hypothetical protein
MTMKSSTLKNMITVAVLAATMLLTASAFAQGETNQYRTNIPFAFQVGGKILPAGYYNIRLTDHFVQFQNLETNKGVGVVAIRTEQKHSAEKNSMEFNVYGKQYFVSNLWFQGSQSGRSVILSKAEQEIARQGPGSPVVLAMKLKK